MPLNLERGLSWRDQEARIDRLMKIIEAKDSHALAPGLLFTDIVIFTCQCMWHLKDWVLNDPEFDAQSKQGLRSDIHSEKCLLACSDIANRSKHYSLSSAKTDTSHFMSAGIHAGRSVWQEYVWIISDNEDPPYHGMEVRDFLRECRTIWSKLIDKHYLSAYSIVFGANPSGSTT